MKWDEGCGWSCARGAKRCSGRNFSTVARQEIVALYRNGGAGTWLLGGRRDRPDDASVAGYFRALGSSSPVGKRHAQLDFVLDLKKIFSPEQNSGARNVFDGSLVPDRFSHVAEVHRYLKRESDGAHVPYAQQGMCPIECARLEQNGLVENCNYFSPRNGAQWRPSRHEHNKAQSALEEWS